MLYHMLDRAAAVGRMVDLAGTRPSSEIYTIDYACHDGPGITGIYGKLYSAIRQDRRLCTFILLFAKSVAVIGQGVSDSTAMRRRRSLYGSQPGIKPRLSAQLFRGNEK